MAISVSKLLIIPPSHLEFFLLFYSYPSLLNFIILTLLMSQNLFLFDNSLCYATFSETLGEMIV